MVSDFHATVCLLLDNITPLASETTTSRSRTLLWCLFDVVFVLHDQGWVSWGKVSEVASPSGVRVGRIVVAGCR